jgi:hypothetical protein
VARPPKDVVSDLEARRHCRHAVAWSAIGRGVSAVGLGPIAGTMASTRGATWVLGAAGGVEACAVVGEGVV